MTEYKTQLFTDFEIPDISNIELVLDEDLYRPKSSGIVIKRITTIVEVDTGVIVAPVLQHLVSRHFDGLNNSSSESLGLRLYFDFLSAIGAEWDEGSNIPHERPLHQFSRHLTDIYAQGRISGSTARAYFSSVVRFYKFHIKFDYPFKGIPLEFKETVIKKYDNDSLSHIYEREIRYDTATCTPRIPQKDQRRELRPIPADYLNEFLALVANNASIEMALIIFTSYVTGLRANEIADLRCDMINGWDGVSDNFNILVGPQVGHQTKYMKDGTVTASNRLMKTLKSYGVSDHYLHRLSKYQGDRTHVFLTRSGKPFSQKTISTEFRRFIREWIHPEKSDFDHKFHDIRTSFGCYLAKSLLEKEEYSGAEIMAEVQESMRHKDIATTELYLRYWTRTMMQKDRDAYTEDKLSEAFDVLDAGVDSL
ncbi:hypothetical protein XM69_c12008 [Vibrio parahaemolyticus]|uniref:tyrosine-type recombinase/integrase n=1 Tax=Vibrio parahaemolyticus TaxID=670 RepID=UPI0009B6D0E7|nr:tyrosine-type recombinase/integrase [Vibrio parahaemolyticus]OQK25769.1 hypothetical protein XM69_c12008 [Vibrio parahaemolyticus]